jgi:hypothetical protein
VRDVAAHLLDIDLRKLAVYRDGHHLPQDAPIASSADLLAFITAINGSGVHFAQRLSTRLIADLLELTGAWVTAVVTALPPRGPAIFPVSWAGEDQSENWMDTGRDYTERWHHQMQIRDAVAAPLLLQPLWMGPLLDISVRAFPPAYAQVAAPPGTAVQFEVVGETHGTWTLVAGDDRWRIGPGAAVNPACAIRCSSDAAWRLLFNALPPEQLQQHVVVTGERALAAPLLRARSVIV